MGRVTGPSDVPPRPEPTSTAPGLAGGDDPGAISLSVLELIPQGVVVLDADWVYRYVNPAGAAFLGTTVDALLGNDYRVLYPEAEGTTFQQTYARVMRTQTAETIDEHYPPWDKHFRNSVLPWHGGIAVFFSDVTDERRAQAQQAQELESCSRSSTTPTP